MVFSDNEVSVDDDAIFKVAKYSVNGGNWMDFTLAGAQSNINDDWLVTDGAFNLPGSLFEDPGEHYLAVYSCSRHTDYPATDPLGWDCHPSAGKPNGNWQLYTISNGPGGCTAHSQCNDGDDCTEDSCNFGTGDCEHTDIPGCGGDPCDGVVCDDGDECTEDECIDGSCAYDPIPDCGVDPCAGTLYDCGSPGNCQSCVDDDDCTDDSCENNACVNDIIPGCGVVCSSGADCPPLMVCVDDYCSDVRHYSCHGDVNCNEYPGTGSDYTYVCEVYNGLDAMTMIQCSDGCEVAYHVADDDGSLSSAELNAIFCSPDPNICVSDADCDEGYVCIDDVCVVEPECSDDPDCVELRGSSYICEGGSCYASYRYSCYDNVACSGGFGYGIGNPYVCAMPPGDDRFYVLECENGCRVSQTPSPDPRGPMSDADLRSAICEPECSSDPDCVENVTGNIGYTNVEMEMKEALMKELVKSKDPRVVGPIKEVFDSYLRYSSLRYFPDPKATE